MVMGQSIVLSEIKTEVPLENDDPAYQNLLLQRYEERIKSLYTIKNVQESTERSESNKYYGNISKHRRWNVAKD